MGYVNHGSYMSNARIQLCTINSCTIHSYTSKEKHSLTRKLVGYRNWRQRWCKKEGNKKINDTKNPIFSTSFGSVTFTRAKYRICSIIYLFPKPCFLPFYTTFASNSYPTNFLVRECFSLLVSLIFSLSLFIDYYYWQIAPPPPPLQLPSRADVRFCLGSL